jgi:hypothetical protein
VLLKRLAFALVLLGVGGCPANPGECKLPDPSMLGGANGDGLEAQLVAADNAGAMHVISDGDPVTLMRAPQGGHILLVGARIHNDDTCQLDATGSLRDTASNRVLGLDERSMYLTKTGDGWSQPEASLSAAPNVAVCPNSATTAAVAGNIYQLEIALVDSSGAQVADVKANVIPTCDADDTYCTQECGPTQGR